MGAFAAPIVAALSGLAGAFGKSKQTSDTTSNSTTTPQYDPASLALKNFLLKAFQDNVSTLPDWNKSYETSGVQNLVNSSTNAAQAAADAIAARGISRTTAGANAIGDQSYQQGRQISSFLNNAPIVEQAQKDSRLTGAGGFLASLPVGSTTSGTSHTVGTGGPSSPIAGFINGGAQGLAGVLGQQYATQSLGNILKGLGLKSNGTGSPTGTTSTTPNNYAVPGIVQDNTYGDFPESPALSFGGGSGSGSPNISFGNPPPSPKSNAANDYYATYDEYGFRRR